MLCLYVNFWWTCFLTDRLITACGNFIHFLHNFSFVDFIHRQVAYLQVHNGRTFRVLVSFFNVRIVVLSVTITDLYLQLNLALNFPSHRLFVRLPIILRENYSIPTPLPLRLEPTFNCALTLKLSSGKGKKWSDIAYDLLHFGLWLV